MHIAGRRAGFGAALLHIIHEENRAINHGRKAYSRCNQQIKPHALSPLLCNGSARLGLESCQKIGRKRLGPLACPVGRSLHSPPPSTDHFNVGDCESCRIAHSIERLGTAAAGLRSRLVACKRGANHKPWLEGPARTQATNQAPCAAVALKWDSSDWA